MKKTVAVLYGGMSTEHEIAIITALQAMSALKEAGHEVVPIYITKNGQWIKGDDRFLKPAFYRNLNQPIVFGKPQSITPANPASFVTKGAFNRWTANRPVDILFPIFHGAFGEDGSMQGLIKLLNLPIAGSSLIHTTVAMDKYLSKRLATSLGIHVVPDVLLTKTNWTTHQAESLKLINSLGPDVIIKPNTLGSSIGIGIAHSEKERINALEVAFAYDTRVLIEKLLPNPTEINIAIMGNDPYQFSATEQPIKKSELLSFEDKYLGNGAKKTGAKGMAGSERLIPAPIKPEVETEIKTAAESFFRAVNGHGMARIDFMISHNVIYFNEMNSIPGSLAFYLWNKAGISFPQLMDHLIELGLEAYAEDNKLVKTFESNILSQLGTLGPKAQ